MVSTIFDWAFPIVIASVLQWNGPGAYLSYIADQKLLKTNLEKTIKTARDTIDKGKSREAFKAYQEFSLLAMSRLGYGHGGATFSKFNELLKSDPESLKKSFDFTIEMVEANIRNAEGDQKKYDEAWGKLKGIAGSAHGIERNGQIKQDFNLDLSGWRYKIDLEAHMEKKIQDTIKTLNLGKTDDPKQNKANESLLEMYREGIAGGIKSWKIIHVKLNGDYGGGKNPGGQWQAPLKTLSLWFPVEAEGGIRELNPKQLEDQFRQTIRHELQHLAQAYLSFSVNMDNWTAPVAGLPGQRMKTPQYKQWMMKDFPANAKTEEDGKQRQERLKALLKLKNQGVQNFQETDIHALDDIEFQTRLTDSIYKFKKMLVLLPDADPERALKIFVGLLPRPSYEEANYGPYAGIYQDKFFGTLSRVPDAAGKYRKALVEIYKATHLSSPLPPSRFPVAPKTVAPEPVVHEPKEDSRLGSLRDLWKAARAGSDDWTMKFVKSIGDQIKAGKKLTYKQTDILGRKFKQYKIEPGKGF